MALTFTDEAYSASVISTVISVDSADCRKALKDQKGKNFILARISVASGMEIENVTASATGRNIICVVGATGQSGNKRIGGIRLYPDTLLPFKAS